MDDLPVDDNEDYFDPSLIMNWEDECSSGMIGGCGSGVGGGMDARSQFSFASSSQDSLQQLQQVLAGTCSDPPMTTTNLAGKSVSSSVAGAGTTQVPLSASSSSSWSSSTGNNNVMMNMIASSYPLLAGGNPLAMSSITHPYMGDTYLPSLFAMIHGQQSNVVQGGGGGGVGGATTDQQQMQHPPMQSSSSMTSSFMTGETQPPPCHWHPSSSPFLPPMLLSAAAEATTTTSGNNYGGGGNNGNGSQPNPFMLNSTNNNNNNNSSSVDQSVYASIINNANNNNNNSNSNFMSKSASASSTLTSWQQQQQFNAAAHLSQLISNFQASNKANKNNTNNNNSSCSSMPPPPPHVMASQLQPQHYGIIVNGFHPQVNAQANNVGNLNGASSLLSSSSHQHHQRHDNNHNSNRQQTTSIQLQVQNLQQQQQQVAVRANVNGSASNSYTNNNMNKTSGTTAAAVSTITANTTNQEQEYNQQQQQQQQHLLSLSPSARAIAASANTQIRIIENADNNVPLMSLNGLLSNGQCSSSSSSSQHGCNSKERNEREQIRAKKITQLISDLRCKMQGGGWRMEMKSKYQVLSQCKDYMDYLKRYHKEKEAEIEQTKRLFKEHQQQQQMQAIAVKKGTYVDEKKCDSGTESLSNQEQQQQQQQQQKSMKKRSHTRSMARASSTNDDEAVMDEHQSCADDMSGISDNEVSCCSTTPSDRTSNFVDDKDKSNMTNSSNTLGEGIGVGGGMVEEKKADDDDDQSVAASSASSTAAVVVRGLRSSKQVKKRIRVDYCSSNNNLLSPPLTIGEGMTNNHKNNNITNTNKEGHSRSYYVGTSIVTASTSHHGKKLKRRGFHYDYREVFLKSNVPQFIASLSGRIVVWNDIFLLASGLSERDVQRLTLFSIVESCQLSIMYKMVARALADEKKSVVHPTTANTTFSAIAAKKNIISSDKEEWQTITLKCIPFTRPTNNNNSKTNERMIARSKTRMATESDVVTTHQQPLNPLYINVAFMDDDDLEKRCFHCILTDCPPGLNGKLGGGTPKLFAATNSGTKKEVVA